MLILRYHKSMKSPKKIFLEEIGKLVDIAAIIINEENIIKVVTDFLNALETARILQNKDLKALLIKKTTEVVKKISTKYINKENILNFAETMYDIVEDTVNTIAVSIKSLLVAFVLLIFSTIVITGRKMTVTLFLITFSLILLIIILFILGP